VNVLIAVAVVTAPVAKVPTQILLVPPAFADILTALLARVIVPDLSRVLPQLATILPDFMVVAAKLAGVTMDVTPVRAKLVRFAMRHARVQWRVRVVETLCAYEVRTSNEQGRGSGSDFEIAHGFSQRQYRARHRSVRCIFDGRSLPDVKSEARVRSSPGGNFCRSYFPR
jgi:hypothetical protein